MPMEAAVIALAVLLLFVLFQLKLTRNELFRLSKSIEGNSPKELVVTKPAQPGIGTAAADADDEAELAAVLTAAILAYEAEHNQAAGLGNSTATGLNAAGFRIRRITRLA